MTFLEMGLVIQVVSIGTHVTSQDPVEHCLEEL